MPHLILKLIQSKGTVKLNFGAEKCGHIRIVRYQATGLTNISPLFVRFSGAINTTLTVTGCDQPALIPVFSTEFIMPVVAIPDSSWEFNNSILLTEGDDLLTGAKEFEYAVTDFNGNPATFQAIAIDMEMTSPSRYNAVGGNNRVLQREAVNTSERNEYFRPFFGNMYDRNVDINFNNM